MFQQLLPLACRRSLSIAVLVASLAAPLSRAQGDGRPLSDAGAPAAAPRRNVFLISIDTLRADHLGLYGYPRLTSPHLDELARRHVVFRNALCQWPKTTPSFASLFTGLHPQTTGIMRICPLTVADDFELLAERFKAGGWRTLAVVSNPNLDAACGFAQGFDDYTETWKSEQKGRATRRAAPRSPKSYARFVNEQFFSALDRSDPSAALFAWIHYSDPHAPYAPPPQYASKFVDDPWYDAARRVPLLEEGVGVEALGGIPPFARLADRTELAWYVAQYDAEIFTVDEQIQVLLNGLTRRGLLEDALIIITADHGESLGEHDWYCEHGPHPYDDCARVPLMVLVPGSPLAVTIDEPVGLIDLAPTMLSFAHLPPDPVLEGRDLSPLILGEAIPHEAVFTGAGYADDAMVAVRVGRWKLIHVPDPAERARLTGSEWELYDLEADPGESTNLAEARPEVVESMRRRMFTWLAERHARAHTDGAVVPVLDARTEELLRRLGYIK